MSKYEEEDDHVQVSMARRLGALFVMAIIGAFVVLMLVISAPSKAAAADKGVGGDCCSDLEERIAELEATTARKGNRKVSLQISGVVNEAIVFWGDGLLGDSDASVRPNGINPSRIAFTGDAKISKGWTAGFIIEVGVGSADALTAALNVASETEVYVRQSAVWVKTPAGQITLGRTAQATYRIADTSIANVHDADEMLSLCPFLGCDHGITQNLDLYSGQFLNLIKYTSPEFYGFVASASWSNDGTSGLLIPGQKESVWDVALRFSQEIEQFKVAASVGYRDGAVFPGLSPILPLPIVAFDQKTWSGSASFMHVPTGLFLDVAAGRATFPGSFDITSWEVRPGIEEKWTPLGKTTVFALYSSTKVDGLDDDVVYWGGGVVQAIDPAALNLYATVKRLDAGNGIPETTLGMAGASLKF